MKELLDDYPPSTIFTLSDHQLASLLPHTKCLDDDFATTLMDEITRRDLSALQIQQLVIDNTTTERLSKPVLLDKYQVRMLVGTVLLLAIIAHFSIFFIGIVLLSVNLRAVRRYWTVNPDAAKTTWRRFGYALLVFTLLIYALVLLF